MSEDQAVAANAARGFDVFQCQECAENVKKRLLLDGRHGQWLEIRGAGGGDFMICRTHDGGRSTITQNGRHVGIRVGDMVFDNLHPDGLPFDAWLSDFDAIGGVFIHAASDF